ncbi:unnamed protein product [Closterium sp. NIES-65]|nr:unnamed protein product [Closterium sp. NIES-65]
MRAVRNKAKTCHALFLPLSPSCSSPSISSQPRPFSGLDARAAAIVMRAVRNTVNTGRTVVCTIHQLSIDIFEAFDEVTGRYDLLLMQRGGEVIYAGSLGKQSCDLVRYFKAIPGVPPIQPGANPAAWMLEVTASASAERLRVDFAHLFLQSDLFRSIQAFFQLLRLTPLFSLTLFSPLPSLPCPRLSLTLFSPLRSALFSPLRSSLPCAILSLALFPPLPSSLPCSLSSLPSSLPCPVLSIEALIYESSMFPKGEPDLHFPTHYPTTLLSQFATHVWKRHRMYWRMPDYNDARLFFSFVMSLLIGGVFFGSGNSRETPQQIVNVMGALYTAALFLGWSNLASIQPMLAVERSIYYHERGAEMYSAIPYALAQGVIELPYLLVQTVVYSLLTYCMILFEWTPRKFLWYLLFQFLTLLYFTCFGMIASAITPAEGLGMLFSAFIYSFWNLLYGFLLPQPESAVLVALCCRFSSGDGARLPWHTLKSLGDVTTLVVNPPSMPDQTVSQFIQLYYGFSHDWLGYAVVALLGFSCLFFYVCTYALRNLNFQMR